MTTISGSRFQVAMAGPQGRVLAATTLLAWMAASDGEVSSEQIKLLRAFSIADKNPGTVELALAVVRERDLDALTQACEFVQNLPSATEAKFMQWAISVATANKKVSDSANYVLRFLADLTGVDLAEACQIANKALPFPGDPSSVEWWRKSAATAKDASRQRANESQQKQSSQKTDQQNGSKSAVQRGTMATADALEVLGLKEGASRTKISQAFRRLAAIHHPDRYSQAEPEEQQAAARTFTRVRAAFEALTQS